MPSFILLRPNVWPQCTKVTDRTGQRSDTIGRTVLGQSYNMVNVGPLTAEICWRVWGTPANFNGFRVLAALLHGTLVVGVS